MHVEERLGYTRNALSSSWMYGFGVVLTKSNRIVISYVMQ